MSRLLPFAAAVYLLALAVAFPSAQSLDGKAVFRFDTFGDEQLWTDVLQMQHVVSTVSPATALSVGLKWMRTPCRGRC